MDCTSHDLDYSLQVQPTCHPTSCFICYSYLVCTVDAANTLASFAVGMFVDYSRQILCTEATIEMSNSMSNSNSRLMGTASAIADYNTDC